MKRLEFLMMLILVGSLILYIWGLFVIGKASAGAVEKPPEVNKQWVDVVAGVTTVLAMNAGAYLGLPSQRLFRFKTLLDPDTIRFIATVIYVLALFVAFLIAANSEFPHPSLTDMGATRVGFITGALTVALGRSNSTGA